MVYYYINIYLLSHLFFIWLKNCWNIFRCTPAFDSSTTELKQENEAENISICKDHFNPY